MKITRNTPQGRGSLNPSRWWLIIAIHILRRYSVYVPSTSSETARPPRFPDTIEFTKLLLLITPRIATCRYDSSKVGQRQVGYREQKIIVLLWVFCSSTDIRLAQRHVGSAVPHVRVLFKTAPVQTRPRWFMSPATTGLCRFSNGPQISGQYDSVSKVPFVIGSSRSVCVPPAPERRSPFVDIRLSCCAVKISAKWSDRFRCPICQKGSASNLGHRSAYATAPRGSAERLILAFKLPSRGTSALPFILSVAVTVYLTYGTSPLTAVPRTATAFVQRMASNPQVAELFRFIFLGTIVETGRRLGQTVLDFGTSLFVVKAEFNTGDFAFDWVVNYMENHRVWNESRSFKVVARNAVTRPNHSLNLGRVDGHPDAIYEPAAATPSVFRWHGYWMSVNKSVAGYAHYDTGEEVGGTLIISIWSRNRKILDDFVQAAREFYINSKVLPRKVDTEKEPSGALLTAEFAQSDLSHDWMLAYLRSNNALQDAMKFTISTKQSNLGWGTGPKDTVRYMPAHDSQQRFLYVSPNTGRSTWLQVVVKPGQQNWNQNTPTGGSITITLHSSDKDVLADLIDCAHKQYLENGISRVAVHLTDNRGEWAKTVTKSRRSLNTLILPTDIKEMILADAREFLASETWYQQAGIPHRRGYLLYGEPGTGKSSTIHALAGELGLEIYFISLASPGIDDYSLAKLISDTPSRCILLIEDIDCAFPSRDDGDDEEDEPILDKDGKPVGRNAMPPRSNVTLSGLLNVLDSVSSEEGRLTFATTNHIENLDSALIRAGRMDVKIQYNFADSEQIAQVFKRFFPLPNESSALETAEGDVNVSFFASYTEAQLDDYAADFARAIPAATYSIAQIQGYLLTKKWNPGGAVEGVQGWLKSQEEEKRALTELKQKRKVERARKLKLAREKAEAAAAEAKKSADTDGGPQESHAGPSINGNGIAGKLTNGVDAAD